MQRKFKVTTRIVSYVWAESPEDAEKFQQQLIRKDQLSIEKNGETIVKYSRALGVPFLEAPEDISKTRNPIEKPRPLDWIEISHDGMSMVALVTKLSKRRIYYYEALTQSHRSIDRDAWARWASNHKVHPSYEETLPPFIVNEAIREHEEKNLIGQGGQPESAIILRVLEKYGYEPTDYELRNGYWAENAMERAITEYIINKAPKGGDDGQKAAIVDEWDIQLASDVPTLDEL